MATELLYKNLSDYAIPEELMDTSAADQLLEGVFVDPLHSSHKLQAEISDRGEAPYVQGVTCRKFGLLSDSEITTLLNARELIVFDHKAKLISPHSSYPILMARLGYSDDLTSASISHYDSRFCPAENRSLHFAVVRGGKYNPYVAYTRAQKSALRSVRSLKAFEHLISISQPVGLEPGDFEPYNKCELGDLYLISITLTYPKQLSNLMLNDPKKRSEITSKVLKNFMLLFRQIVAPGRTECELGLTENIHSWRSHPFDADGGQIDLTHFHHHLKIVSCLFNTKNHKFEYFNPKTFKPVKVTTDEGDARVIINFYNSKLHQLKESFSYLIEDLLQKEGLSNNQTTLSGESLVAPIDLHVEFIPFSNQGKLVHALKYQTRSIVVDLANWCNDHSNLEWFTSEIEELKKHFNAGALLNKSKPRGFWRRLKARIREYEYYSQTLIDHALESVGELALSNAADHLCLSELAERERLKLVQERIAIFESFRSDSEKVCPFCGSPLLYLPTRPENTSSILKVELNAKGEVCSIFR